jgi:enamine deaminase RidA (YjgF/YER057c/UK114 family)
MTITLLSPDGLPKVDSYHQVSVATGTRTVFVAGQVARDADGNRIGEGDLAAQVEQSYVNVATALAAAGASFADAVKLTLYVVDWSIDKMPLVVEGLGRAAAGLGEEPRPMPPSSLIGVAALAEPDLLVEIEAIAVLA